MMNETTIAKTKVGQVVYFKSKKYTVKRITDQGAEVVSINGFLDSLPLKTKVNTGNKENGHLYNTTNDHI